MATGSMDDYNGCAWFVILGVIGFLGLIIFVQFSAQYGCVVAPSGHLLSRNAPYRSPTIEPYIAIFDPDGQLMTYGIGDFEFWSTDGFAGWVSNEQGSGVGLFVFNNEFGFSLSRDNHDDYERIYALTQPNKTRPGINLNSNLYGYFSIFSGQMEGYERWENHRLFC